MDRLEQILINHPDLKKILNTYWENLAEDSDYWSGDQFEVGGKFFRESVVSSFMDNINDMTKEDALEALAGVIRELLETK